MFLLWDSCKEDMEDGICMVDGKRVDGPLRATEELANEDLAEARWGISRPSIEIVRRTHQGAYKAISLQRKRVGGLSGKTVCSLGGIQQTSRGKWRLTNTANKRASQR